ncbi:MAG: hypothetical protein CMI03_08485 [Oceanospirillaceae bacterium]|uniref:hypothetical protein n=1 Tax=unclassified Thalassolituus TaxID=2624967 RepID=UPI000C681419|nr:MULTISPECIES: hypothetical protein [unclassified Thalassolituus]MBL34274.1 hypothetical protein [Oceanospirillaceae bacterium]MBS52774.1 hypothetical protein [Oceanospirillaceae bacterium]|tara:strand:+ start:832 stop:1428 length:597 start_codon:yes stop_codon:yes gene_type:complete
MATPIFVTAASIAAELHQAMLEAKGLALTAKNARALAVRAGSKTVGFKAITHFIDELASDIIRQSQYINGVSEGLSQHAVALWRAALAAEKFDWIAHQHDRNLDSLQSAMNQSRQQREELSAALTRGLRELEQQLEEGDKHIRTANLIATSSKVEAASAGDFRNQLEVIAQNITDTADKIRKHLSKARNLLSQKQNYA